MLFRKKIERSCSYCMRSSHVDEDTVLCIKRGLKSSSESCRSFRYDPCKRIPYKAKAVDFSQFNDRDFSLD